MRFCMITTFYPPYAFGGDGIYVAQLTRELARAGHEVEVVSCFDSYRLLGGTRAQAEDEPRRGVTVHRLASRFGRLSPLATQQSGYPWFKSRQLRKILSRRFDVIHFHNISLVGGPAILRYGSAVKLYTAHEYWLDCPTHLLMKWRQSPCTKKSCFACTLVHARPPQWWRYSGLLRSAIEELDAILVPSAFSGELHRRLDLDVPIHHLPNFAPSLSDFGGLDGSSSYQAERPYFLFAGRLEYAKGVQSILPLFRDLPEADLLIAGEGTQARFLKRQAVNMHNVHFLGWVDAEQLGPIYRSAVAVVVPSLWYEVCPLVILEAFKHGTPVLARDLGGMKELVTENRAGAVFHSPSELLGRMRAILEQPTLRERWSQRAREAHLERYSAQSHMRRYFEILDAIAKCVLPSKGPHSNGMREIDGDA